METFTLVRRLGPNFTIRIHHYFNHHFILGMDETRKARYEEVKKVGDEIMQLVKECQKLFQATEDSVHWHAYLDFIEGIIKSGKIYFVF